MGTSCITTVTAFVVVNAQRLGMRTFDLAPLGRPIAVLGVGLTIWRRSYAKRFALIVDARVSIPWGRTPYFHGIAAVIPRDRCSDPEGSVR